MYFLTSFVKVVYKAQKLIGIVFDTIRNSRQSTLGSPQFPAAELSKIIDTLISNSEIKEILVSRQRNNNIPAEKEIAYNREPVTKRSSIHQSSNIYAHTI
jgi:hypothetical protein